MLKKLTAEFIGTFMLVASAVGAGGLGLINGSYLHVAIAIGLAVMVMAYAVGHISGGHFNPAVTCGLVAAGRHPVADAIPYIIAQVLGACAAGFVYSVIGHSMIVDAGKTVDLGSFAANGYDALSPGHYPMISGAIAEVVGTALFLFVIVGATSKRAPAGFAPIAIGWALAVLLLITIPVTNGALNPARATGAALFAGTAYIAQLWLFWVAPIAGAVIGGLVARFVQRED